MSDYIVEVEDLSHTYHTHEKGEGFLGSLKDLMRRSRIYAQALQNVSFRISPGEIVGLLGPNGAGKTTLLKILSGLIHPTSGKALVIGNTPHRKERPFLKQIGMVMGQKSQLFWDIPAIDTLHIIRELYGIPRQVFDARLAEFVDLLSIGQLLKTPVRTLSLGERMKFELVASLIHNPKLLFLDEPTIGLDIVSQRAIRDFLLQVNKLHGTTIIITSHYMKDIEILAKRILIIKKGNILYDASLDGLLKKFEHLQKVFFSADDGFQLRLPYEKISLREYAVTCHPKDLQKVVSEIVSQVPIISVRTEETSLEDAIFSIFDEKKGS
jgi:ABC-2 type transport system ATP-binding protein